MAEVTDQRGELDGQPVFWREAATPRDAAPVLYLHGVPTSSDDWLPFLARTGGLAPDLPGFGRSGKRGDLPYDLPFFDAWVERFLAWRGIERVRLVVHGWGVVGLLWAQRFPERVERLVIVDGVPLLPGFRWHRAARLWRTPVVGEIAMGLTTKGMLRRAGVPAEVAEQAMEHFDAGTQRAILRLYRAAPPAALAEAGRRLGDLSCPALIVWGQEDPFVTSNFADGYRDALPVSEVRHLARAGHWPWQGRPELIEQIGTFLDGRR